MSAWTLCRFLFGSRDAIRKVAETRSAVWLGLLFVISAGFAREYDGEDLWHEPWHLGIPLAASLATSFLLFLLVCFAGGLSRWRVGTFATEYGRFLGLYWMTAPLAWLYAIPVERWMSAAEATQANLSLLGLVALWRVVLMIRIITVVYSTRWYTALFVVMFFADTVMLTLLFLTPLPVFEIMGGVRLSASEQIILSASLTARVLGAITWPLWFIATAVILGSRGLQPYKLNEQFEKRAVGLSTWLLGTLALLVWIPILTRTQPEQQLRYVVERDLHSGQIERALDIMSEHERSDFPTHWDPPPRVGYGETSPPILDVLETVVERDVAVWVRKIYQQKFEDYLGDGHFAYFFWQDMDNDEFERHLNLLEQLPVSPELLEDHAGPLRDQVSKDSERTEQQKSRLRKLLGQTNDREASVNRLPAPVGTRPASAGSSSLSERGFPNDHEKKPLRDRFPKRLFAPE